MPRRAASAKSPMPPSCASSKAGRATSTPGAPARSAFAPTRALTTSSGFTWKTSSAKERLHLGKVARRLHRRQALEDPRAVGLRQEARVAQHQHAAIVLVADQAPCPLL